MRFRIVAAFAAMVVSVVCMYLSAYLAPEIDTFAVYLKFGQYFGRFSGLLFLAIVTFIAGPCMSMPSVIMLRFAVLSGDTQMYAICILLPLLWCVSMLMRMIRILRGDAVNTTSFAISVLLCFNMIAGMILLSAPKLACKRVR